MEQIALIAGAAAILAAAMALIAARRERPSPDWESITRKHEPYTNLNDNEVKSVNDRDEFTGALKTSLERHYTSKPLVEEMKRGRYTRNMLYEEVEKTVERCAGDILMPQERDSLVEKVYIDVTAGWSKERKAARARSQT